MLSTFTLLQATADPVLPSGYGASLLQTLLALAAVCILAWVVLKWGAKKGLGLGVRGRHIQVLERVPLDPRRALALVKVGERVLLIGIGDGGAPALLKEVDPSELDDTPPPPTRSFKETLARLRGEEVQGEEE